MSDTSSLREVKHFDFLLFLAGHWDLDCESGCHCVKYELESDFGVILVASKLGKAPLVVCGEGTSQDSGGSVTTVYIVQILGFDKHAKLLVCPDNKVHIPKVEEVFAVFCVNVNEICNLFGNSALLNLDSVGRDEMRAQIEAMVGGKKEA